MTTTLQTTKTQKSKNQFASLPEADRHRLLDLCSQHTYDQAVDLLRKPRTEGGLNIRTSAAALCRYFTAAQPDLDRALLAQIAAAANIQHEQHSNAFLGAIRATVEARVLENLRRGRALADMQQEFKLLRTAESLYLADAKFRAEHPKTPRASYEEHVRHCAQNSEVDFISLDDPSASAQLEDQPISNHLTELERDILAERKRRQETDAILAKAGFGPDRLSSLRHAFNPPPQPAKSPVIPHIPPNPTKSVPPTRTDSAPTPPPKPTPHLAPPKIGRNDPCPCGSGRKSKKCCHQ